MELQPSPQNSDSNSDGEISDHESICSALNPSSPPERGITPQGTMAAVDCSDRWQVYFRLKELEIPCQCKSYQPLLVDIRSAQTLVQVWSVVKQVSTPRSHRSEWLNQCLHLPSPQLDF